MDLRRGELLGEVHYSGEEDEWAVRLWDALRVGRRFLVSSESRLRGRSAGEAELTRVGPAVGCGRRARVDEWGALEHDGEEGEGLYREELRLPQEGRGE